MSPMAVSEFAELQEKGNYGKLKSRSYMNIEPDLESSQVLLHGKNNINIKAPPEKQKGNKKKHSRDGDEYKYKSGMFGLFRYATKFDTLVLCIGIVFSIVHGASFPILALVFGKMTDVFIAEAIGEQTTTDFAIDLEKLSTFSEEDAVNIQKGTTSLNLTNLPLDKNNEHEHFTVYLADYSLNYLYIGFMVLIAAFIQTLCWEISCERQVHRLREVAFTQILRQDLSWYDTRQEGNLTNVLSDDVERIREGIGCKFSMVTQYVSTFICGTLVGVAVNWKLAGVLLLAAPILIGATAYLAKLTAGSAAREQLKYGIAGGVAEEVLKSVKTVSAFGREYSEVQRYERALEAGRKLAMKKYFVLAWGLTIVFFLMYAQYGLAFYYGSVLINDGYCTPGSVFTVFFSVLSGAFTLGNALPYVNSVSTAIGSASSVFSIIDRTPEIDSYSVTGIRPLTIKGHIEFHDVHFVYPSRPSIEVLKGLNLDIQPGQTVAIVGPSGSGKSTVIQLLLRYYDVPFGVVQLDGRPLKDLNIQWLRSQIGVVSQEPVLFGVSIAENIRYGREGVSQDDIEMAATMANVHSFIDGLPQGYDTMVGELGGQLSGGQKQRVAIARALIRDPAILLLDEATSALDSESESIVQDALERAMLGRTTVIVAHRLSTIKNADVIYTIDNGHVVEQGSHDDLMKAQGLYYELVNTQAIFNQNDDIDLIDDPDLNTIIPKPRQRIDTSELSLFQPEDQAFPEGEERKVTLWALVRLNRPECVFLLLGLLGCFMSGAIMPIFAFFYGEIFSTFTKTGEELMNAAMLWSVMFVVLGIIAAISIWLEVVAMTIAVEKLVMRLRVMAFCNILRQPVGWFDFGEHASGRLISRLARDAPFIKGAAGLRLGQMLSSMVTLVAALSVAFVFGWKLALVLLLMVPLIAGGAYHQTLMVRRTQQRDSKFMDDAGRVASECVQNVKTVQALCRERQFVKHYMESLILPFREAKKQAVFYSIIYALSQGVVYVMYAGAFRFGAYLIQINDMIPSDVYRVFFALAFCAASVGTSSAYVQDYNKAKVAARQMFHLIDRKSEIDPLSTLGLRPVIKGLITFNSVYFHYPSRPDIRVFRGVSFTVAPGQTLAFVGPSGSGKSTIVALIQRFYQPTTGTIVMDGTDIQDINVQHLRRHIGLVTQEPLLFNRSIRENITYGLVDDFTAESVMERVVEVAMIANCHSFISELPQGYETKVGEAGSLLSGGQKQRIAIARAIIRDPRILLLDEATSALDSESEKIVQVALDKARNGRTCIVIAHRLSTIQNADLIAVLDQGKVREIGSPSELERRRGLYYQLVKNQRL